MNELGHPDGCVLSAGMFIIDRRNKGSQKLSFTTTTMSSDETSERMLWRKLFRYFCIL